MTITLENKDDNATNSDPVGRICRLPDGQLVIVNEVGADGLVSARRLGGESANTVGFCRLSELRPVTRLASAWGEAASRTGGKRCPVKLAALFNLLFELALELVRA